MLGKIVATSAVLAAVTLVVIVNTTTPTDIGPLGILLVFVLMYTSVLGALTFLLYILSKFIVRISRRFTLRKPLHEIRFVRAYYYASIISLGPVMIIGMQSVGGVGLGEVVLVTLFAVLGCIYIARRGV